LFCVGLKKVFFFFEEIQHIFSSLISDEYEAVMNAQGVVPPSASNHTGTGVFTYNPSTKVLTWNIVHDVVDPTDAAIHGPAGDSDNAPSILSLGTTSPIKGQSTITDDNAKALENVFFFPPRSLRFFDLSTVLCVGRALCSNQHCSTPIW